MMPPGFSGTGGIIMPAFYASLLNRHALQSAVLSLSDRGSRISMTRRSRPWFCFRRNMFVQCLKTYAFPDGNRKTDRM